MRKITLGALLLLSSCKGVPTADSTWRICNKRSTSTSGVCNYTYIAKYRNIDDRLCDGTWEFTETCDKYQMGDTIKHQ